MKKAIFFLLVLFLSSIAIQSWATPPHFNAQVKKLPGGIPRPEHFHHQPDLAVESITISPAHPVVGNRCRIGIKIKNKALKRNPITGHRESVRTERTRLRLSIGTASPIDLTVPPLDGGEQVNLSRQYTPTQGGTLTITAVVDPNNNLKERNRKNNTLTKSFHIAELPDLRVINFTATPREVRLPGSMHIVATVKNFGGLSGKTSMLVSIHGDIPHDMDVVQNLEGTVKALGHNATAKVSLPFTPVKAGMYTIGGMVDNRKKIAESNEHNNGVPAILKIPVKAGTADLDLVSLSSNHRQRHWYQNFVVTAVVKNRGNLASGPFKVHLYRLHDKPAGWAQGSRKDSAKDCPSLNNNQTCTVKFTFKYKVYVGNPQVEVKVDPERRVNDNNRRNNKRSLNLLVL